MAQLVRYRDPDGAWSETLTTKRPEDLELEESGEFAQAAMAKIVVDDDDATVGHDGDAILGLQTLDVLETAAPVGDQRLWTGFTGKRSYRRSANYGTVGPEAREIEIQGVEDNSLLSDHVVHGAGAGGGKRPREKASVRLAWLLASGFIDCEDRGKVVYPSTYMDENDYRGQRGGDVLADIAAVTGYDFTTLNDDEAETVPELFFDDFDRSEVYTTTAKISNAGDDDGTTIFAPLDPGEDEKLERDPENVASGGFGAYARGNVYETNAATAARFRSRDTTITTSQAKTAAQARRIVQKDLAEHAEETDTLSLAFLCEPADVNKIRRAHRLEACVTYAPGYESYRWCRVVSRRITMPAGHDLLYRVDVILTPMATAGACTTEINQAHGTVTGHVEATAGITWAHATWSCWPYSLPGTCDDPVSSIPVTDPTKANDGDATTYSWVNQVTLRTDGTATAYWESALDDTYTLCSTRGTNAVGADSWQSMPPDRIQYWDGAAWLDAAGSFSYTPALPTPQYWVFTFAEPIETTKLRIGYSQVGVSVIAGLWNFLGGGRRVYDWVIYTA